MKFRSFSLFAAAALLVSGSAFAAGNHQFGIEGGTSLPAGDFGDAASTGYNLGGFYQFMMGMGSGSLGAGTEVKYHAWGSSDQLPAGVDASTAAWQFGAYGLYAMPLQAATPYVKVGLGLYSPSVEVSAPGGNSDMSDGLFGMSFGVGADFPIEGSMLFGVGAAYHVLRNKDSEIQSGTEALDTDFFSVNARVTWPLKLGMR